MDENASRNVIHTENLKKYYVMGDIEVRALHDISIDINYGEFTAIMGPSGSGKSTLMNILGCLDRPTAGKYILDGIDVSEMNDSQLAEIRNRKIGFVFQSFNLLPRSSALDNVILPLLYSKNKSHARERAEDALKQVGLEARMKHKPKELSGGQQQRVAIARALVNDPEIIMADEPTGNLDSKSGREVMELLIRLNQEQGKTIIMVTHDGRIGQQVPRVINVFDGMILPENGSASNGLTSLHDSLNLNGLNINQNSPNPLQSEEEDEHAVANALERAFGKNKTEVSGKDRIGEGELQ